MQGLSAQSEAEEHFDLVAFGAHPDDVELSAGGTIARAVAAGRRVALVDLTRGELGTRGSAELRAVEAAEAARVLGIAHREQCGLPDGLFGDDEDALGRVVEAIRRLRPAVVLANAREDRHPDHGRGAALVERACFLAGLPRFQPGQAPWRPRLVLHYVQDRFRVPTIVFDITGFEQTKYAAIAAYSSQFYAPEVSDSALPATPISSPEFLENLRGKDAVMGRYIGVRSGEGFESSRPLGVTGFDALF